MEGERLVLVPGPEAASIARGYTRTSLSGLPDAMVEDALLIVTELVTNAVVHAGCGRDGRLTVMWAVEGPCARIEVRDAGPCFEAGRHRLPRAGASGGRGLFIVGELARRWGSERSDEGCLAWAELDAPATGVGRTIPGERAPAV